MDGPPLRATAVPRALPLRGPLRGSRRLRLPAARLGRVLPELPVRAVVRERRRVRGARPVRVPAQRERARVRAARVRPALRRPGRLRARQHLRLRARRRGAPLRAQEQPRAGRVGSGERQRRRRPAPLGAAPLRRRRRRRQQRVAPHTPLAHISPSPCTLRREQSRMRASRTLALRPVDAMRVYSARVTFDFRSS